MPVIDAFMGFLILAALMLAVAVWLPLRALNRGDRAAPGISGEAINAAVYRSELASLERTAAAGALPEAEYRAARDDVMRRALADLAPPPGAQSPHPSGRVLSAFVALSIPVLAVALYSGVGNPQAIREAGGLPPIITLTAEELPAAADRLEQHLARTPHDARAWVMLARIQAELNRYERAVTAFERGLAASTKVARDPLVWCELADALGMAQGRSLRGRPRELIERALALDAAHPRALEMAGSAAYEAGNFTLAAAYWSRLLGQIEPGTPEHRELRAAVARSERLAGLAPR